MCLSDLIHILIRDRSEVFAKTALGNALRIFTQNHAVSCEAGFRGGQNHMGWLIGLFQFTCKRQNDYVRAVEISHIVLKNQPWPPTGLFAPDSFKFDHVDFADSRGSVSIIHR